MFAFVAVMVVICAVILVGAIYYFRSPMGEHANTDGAAVTVASPRAEATKRAQIDDKCSWPASRGVLHGCDDRPTVIIFDQDSPGMPALVRPYVRHLDRSAFGGRHRWPRSPSRPHPPSVMAEVA